MTIPTFPLSSELKPLGGSKVFDVSENTSASRHPPDSDRGLRSSMYEGLRSQDGERVSVLDNPLLGGVSPARQRQAPEMREKIAFLGR